MKKNDKIKIALIILFFCSLLTWFVSSGTFSAEGAYTSNAISRAGIFDLFLALMYSFYYKIGDIFFLLLLGGSYGVLCKTKSYRKLVDKVVAKVKGREHIFILITNLIMALIISFTNNALIYFVFVPFIVTILLKAGNDRITAIATALGGFFIGVAGMTFGTYGVKYLITAFSLKYVQGIGFKIALFVISYILYNLFVILHLNKQYKRVDETEYDMFNTEEYEEPKKKYQRTSLVPTLIMIALLTITLIIAYIDWETSFGVKLFTNIETKFENLTVKGIPLLYSFLGSTQAFGAWSDCVGGGTIIFITTFIISLMNGMKIDEFIDNFKDGLFKFSKIILIYVLVYSIFIIIMWYGWPTSIINLLLGKGKFNLFTMILAGIICSFFFIENNYTGYLLGEFLAGSFAKKALVTTLVLNSTSAIVMAIAPTSIILMLGLTLLDIPYKKWVQFIWKYVLSFFAIMTIVFAIMCYM